VGLIHLETSELHNCRACLEYTIAANSVKLVVHCNRVHSVGLASVNQLFLHLHNVLRLRNRLLIKIDAAFALGNL